MKKNIGLLKVFMVSLLLILFSCARDTDTIKKSSDNTKIEEVINNVPDSKEITSESTSRLALIDPANINYILISELVHEEVNRVRVSRNLQELKKNLILNKAAIDQNNYVNKLGDLTHNQSSGAKKSLKDRIQYYGGGFQAMAENLLYEGFLIRTINGTQQQIITPSYQEMATKMVNSWMNSPGHRRNLLGPKYDNVGTAIAYNDELKAIFATQVFGKEF